MNPVVDPTKKSFGEWCPRKLSTSKSLKDIIVVSEMHKTDVTMPKPKKSIPWIEQLKLNHSILPKQFRLFDIDWWNCITIDPNLQPDITLLVEECQVLTPELISITGVGRRVWMNTTWIKEQYRQGRPLRMINSSFERLPEKEIIPHLIEGLKTIGCTLHLFNPIELDDGILVARCFRLSF